MERFKVIELIEGFRRSVFRSLLIVMVLSAMSFFFTKKILFLLVRAINVRVYYLGLPEAFVTSMELAFFCGVFLSLPVVAFFVLKELTGTMGMGLRQKLAFGFSTVLLFYLGSLFCYFVVLPSGIQFLLGYEGHGIMAMLSVERFVVFCTAMIFAFGVTFEVPVVLLLLGKAGILRSKNLSKTRRFAILIIAIAAALITPTPDVYNMMLLAVPAYILYEVGILLMRIGERKKG